MHAMLSENFKAAGFPSWRCVYAWTSRQAVEPEAVAADDITKATANKNQFSQDRRS